jgi:hypothetical protein
MGGRHRMNIDNIKIVWDGPERTIPGVGSPTKGAVFSIDRKRGESFISQGYARLYSEILETYDGEED